MRRFVKFQAPLGPGQQQARPGEAITQRLALLREKYPDIEEITRDDVSPVEVTGTIYFGDGILPDLNQLKLAGEEAFDSHFKTLEMVFAVAGNRTLGVVCRACSRKIGEVPGYLEAVAMGPTGEADISERIDEIRSTHLQQAHPGIEPGIL
jgi:hypothetical protein